MPIRLAPKDRERVRIQPEFIEEMLLVRDEHYRYLLGRKMRLEGDAKRHTGTYRGRQDKAELHTIMCALQVMRERGEGLNIGRGGTDYDITRLRKLPYVKMMVHDHKNEDGISYRWLIGETPKFTYLAISDPYYYNRREDRQHEEENGTYEHGPYLICVRRIDLGKTAFKWHLLPKTMPHVRNRHLHVYDKRYDSRSAEGKHNPLDGVQSTCWGRFNGVVQSLCENRDMPGLFGALYQFAEILNLDSPLVILGDCPNIKLIERDYSRAAKEPKRRRNTRRRR